MNFAVMQIVERAIGLAQLILFGFELNPAAICERHQLDQLRICANEIAHYRFLRRDHIDGWDIDLSTIPNDVIEAVIAGHGKTFCDGIALADEINDRLRAAAIRQFQNSGNFITIRFNQMIRAAFFS